MLYGITTSMRNNTRIRQSIIDQIHCRAHSRRRRPRQSTLKWCRLELRCQKHPQPPHQARPPIKVLQVCHRPRSTRPLHRRQALRLSLRLLYGFFLHFILHLPLPLHRCPFIPKRLLPLRHPRQSHTTLRQNRIHILQSNYLLRQLVCSPPSQQLS